MRKNRDFQFTSTHPENQQIEVRLIEVLLYANKVFFTLRKTITLTTA